MAGPRTTRGRLALALATLGGVVLLASTVESWVQPAHVPWPNYADGVPDFISHPSDAFFRLGAGLLGTGALVVVALLRRGVAQRAAWAALAVLGLGGIALGLGGFATVASYPGFGSMVANDMTLTGFQHGALNYVELAGAALLSVSPLAAVRASRSTGR